MKSLVLTWAIHDNKVTTAKTARARFTVWTGLALPFEERWRTETAAHCRCAILPASSITGKGSGSQQLAHLVGCWLCVGCG